MSFQCPNCLSPEGMNIVAALELPSDSRSDEITLQVARCVRCGFAGVVVYQESRRGALDDDSFEAQGYVVPPGDLAQIEVQIRQCPDPAKKDCACLIHRLWSRTDASGRWNGSDLIKATGFFEVK